MFNSLGVTGSARDLSRLSRFGRAAAGAILLALFVASCTFSIGPSEPSPQPSHWPKPSPPPDPVKISTADIQAYWTTTFPEIYNLTYEPVLADNIFAAGKPGVAVPDCNGSSVTAADWEDNAFYCFGDNYVVYDARPSGLISTLRTDYGDGAVGAVFAHEWGHAIQDRAGNTRVPTIYAELQADCFSGSWVAHVATGDVAHLRLAPGDLDRILAAMLTFRDVPGSRATSASAHGSGFDRVSAFQDGYENGAATCVPYFDSPPPITEVRFTSAQEIRSGGNVAAAKVLPATVELLNSFYSQVEPRTYRAVKTSRVFTFDPGKPPKTMPACGDSTLTAEQLTNEVFFCVPNRYVVVDTVYLQRVYDTIGDFGVGTLMAEPWAGYVQGLQGIPGAGTDTTARASDCYTGGFAAALVNGQLSSETMGGPVSASAGDLDESISAFIDADRVHGASGDDVFNRMEAFRDGFLRGYRTCKHYVTDTGSTPVPVA